MKNVLAPTGSIVWVTHDNVEKALRNLKKKVQDSGKLQELRDRETYTKPSIERKQERNKARRRWLKKLESEALPKKEY